MYIKLLNFTLLYLLLALPPGRCVDYKVVISNDGPVVLGANISFKAEMVPLNNGKADDPFRFVWEDSLTPRHSFLDDRNELVSLWNVSYPSHTYKAGVYNVGVNVQQWYFFDWFSRASKVTEFNITDLLNGDLHLRQSGIPILNEFVSISTPVVHEVSLSHPDYVYLTQNATSIKTFWFVDCVYIGETNNYSYVSSYNDENGVHDIEALVVASYEPIPPPTTPAPSTTTTTTTTTTTPKPTTSTTQKPTTTEKPKTTTEKVTTTAKSVTTSVKSVVKREAAENASVVVGDSVQVMKKNSEISRDVEAFKNGSIPFPFVCLNQSTVAADPNKTYGYFHRKIKVLVPVSNLTVDGNNWLQHGDMLELNVKCKGTPPYEYCIQYRTGTYNVTGNETCHNSLLIDSCDFTIIHYFPVMDQHTIVIIVSNQNSKRISPVLIQFYKVTTKAQLSVIVVPVTFSIMAAILMVFGVAYYIQNRSRFTVEVADFNFGKQYTDLEYKTFGERLKNSFNNALNLGAEREGETSTANDNNKYGTMT